MFPAAIRRGEDGVVAGFDLGLLALEANAHGVADRWLPRAGAAGPKPGRALVPFRAPAAVARAEPAVHRGGAKAGERRRIGFMMIRPIRTSLQNVGKRL